MSAAASAEPRPLVLVDTTIEGEEVTYTLEPSPGAHRGRLVRIASEGAAGRKVYLAEGASIVLVRATPDPTPLAPGAGSGRIASEAVNVLVSGRVIFDSAKSYPVRPEATRFRVE